MPARPYRYRSYLCWAVFGALVFGLPVALVLWNTSHDILWYKLVTCFAAAGALLFTLPRAVVGAVTGWPPPVVARAMAFWIGRFFVGLLLGMVVTFVLVTEQVHPGAGRWLEDFMTLWMWLFGGIAMVLTGWLAERRRGWMLLPFAWVTVFVALVGISLLIPQ
jgi:hypothetical protein